MKNELAKRNFQHFNHLFGELSSLTIDRMSRVDGQRDLHYEFLSGDPQTNCRISLSQYSIVDDIGVIDPSVEMLLDCKESSLVVLTLEEPDRYLETYDRSGRPNSVWEGVNKTIGVWLQKLSEQGYDLNHRHDQNPLTHDREEQVPTHF